MKDWKFGLGQPVTDKITKMSGHVTGRADEFTGCNSYVVTFIKKDDPFNPVERQFTEKQLKPYEEGEWLEDSIKELTKESANFVFELGDSCETIRFTEKGYVTLRLQELYNDPLYYLKVGNKRSPFEDSVKKFHSVDIKLSEEPLKGSDGEDMDLEIDTSSTGSCIDVLSRDSMWEKL